MAETLTVRVAEREIQGTDVVVLTLTSLDGAPCRHLVPGRISISISGRRSSASIHCAAALITRSSIAWAFSRIGHRAGDRWRRIGSRSAPR